MTDLANVLSHALAGYQLPRSGAHGVGHWLRALRNGRDIAARTPGADLRVIEAFALLHDSRRVTESTDPRHGQRAAEYVAELPLGLSDAQRGVLQAACARHELGEVSTDPTLGACWDADRLELSRQFRRPIGRLLSTVAALDPVLQADAWRRGGGLAIDRKLAAQLGVPRKVIEQLALEERHRTQTFRCLELHRDGAPAAQIREVLRPTWIQSSHPIVRLAEAEGVEVLSLFRAARFAIPANLPRELTIWRASFGDVEDALRGFSWTLDRTAAFALAGVYMLRANRAGTAIVVKRQIERDRIVFFHRFETGMREVVIDAPAHAEVDGTAWDWAQVALKLSEQTGAMRA